MFSAHSSILLGIWDSSVGIMIMLWAGHPRLNFWQGQEILSSPKCPNQLWSPPIFLLPVWWVKHEFDRFHLSKAKVRNG